MVQVLCKTLLCRGEKTVPILKEFSFLEYLSVPEKIKELFTLRKRHFIKKLERSVRICHIDKRKATSFAY